jgi:hypothetical protein
MRLSAAFPYDVGSRGQALTLWEFDVIDLFTSYGEILGSP